MSSPQLLKRSKNVSFHKSVGNRTTFGFSTRSDGLLGTKIDYQFLGLSRMRNQNISTEILGDLNTGVEDDSFQLGSESEAVEKESLSSVGSDQSSDRRGHGRPYVVATLDGSIILVRDEVILW